MRIFAILFALAMPLLVNAGEETAKKTVFEEGVHYTVISGQPAPAKVGKIKITELFWYGCGHCFHFEPLIHEWEQSLAADVAFSRTPAMWRDNMEIHAKLYYTAKSLGQLDKLHTAFFDAMMKKGKRLVDNAEISAVVTAAGFDGKVFVDTMNNAFALDAQVNAAKKNAKAWGMTGTPEIVVQGYYHISGKKAGGQKEMLEVVDFLLKKIRSKR